MDRVDSITIISEFVVELVETAMQKFKMTYDEVYQLLTRAKYWDRLNNMELALISTHYGVDYILEDLEGYL